MKNHETTTMKSHETTLKNHGNQPKTMKNHENQLSKNVAFLMRDPNWPPFIQKRHITDAGTQLTSFGSKTSHY